MTLPSHNSSIEKILLPAVRDLGDFQVRRALPSAQRRMVGPFIFLDSFGPVVFGPGSGVDTRPHPHIGLATLTYLLEGELVHRDSARHVQTIRAGEVNLMTAGRGIVHSERSGEEARAATSSMFGFQAWLALPSELEEAESGFQHVAAHDLPHEEEGGVSLHLLAGSIEGLRSPTRIFSDTLYADVVIAPGARFRVPAQHVERAAYVVEGDISVVAQDGQFGKDQLVLFKPGAEVLLTSAHGARLMILGGEPLEGQRHIYWNFVSSRAERIDQACDDWLHGRFPGVPGETEFIPLPGRPSRSAA
jgi:redox-sensitive bicupin YhaK (pirin superfamily)